MSKPLAGKIALITGASRGIGASTALHMADQGAVVALCARTLSQCEALVDQIRRAGGDAVALSCDVASYAQVEETVASVVQQYGQLDIMINNAGVIKPISLLADAEPAAWTEAARINFEGVFNGVRAVLPQMLARGNGTIVNVSSGAAHRALEGWSHYCAAKAAAAMLTESTHLECGSQGVRVFGMSPGTVATEMQVLIKASGLNPVSQLDPSVHIDPAWPARAIAWLCLPDADPWLGQEISLRDDAIRQAIGLQE